MSIGFRILLTAPLCAALVALGDPPSRDTAALRSEAQTLVKRFVTTMKPMLQRNLRSHGAADAIDICADSAPAIAERLATDSGWEIRRVSLRPRNTAAAQPDAWERAVMERLAQQLADGKPAGEVNHGEWVDGQFRYLQAQPTEGLCLLCHGGDEVSEEVRTAITARYPDDEAMGFKLGELRGAISLRAPKPDSPHR